MFTPSLLNPLFIYRISDDYIEHFYHLIMTQLNQEHAEIRLSAFNMAAELFSRSHHFRVLLVANMQEFLDLTVETDTDLPLPPPKEVAQKLKRLAIQTVQSWHTTYGEAYKKLALGYHFLKQVKKVITLHCHIMFNKNFILCFVTKPRFIKKDPTF